MNEPGLLWEGATPEDERSAAVAGDPTERSARIERSALWAAYGDALGWISELTDTAGLMKRTGGAPLREPIAWKRRIGGRAGVVASLPQGCYSDDSQLRLATSRAIRSDGFDVEAFAKVELPVWLSYGLGGGKSTSAAAAQLARSKSTWWCNRFKGWMLSGGNGAAMRVQPHVWAARSPENAETYLPDVVRNAVCTHSHPTGLMGAVLHALCVGHAITSGRRPSPDDLQAALRVAEHVPAIIDGDTELGYWRAAFEHEVGDFGEAWAAAADEARKTVELIGACNANASGEARYDSIVSALKLRDPARRGSGMLTALAAAGLAWCEARPAEAMRIAANSMGTDTDTIATMAGAVLGAATDDDPPVEVLDANVFRSEANRLARIAVGDNPPNHPYPDLLRWSAPRSRADTLARSKDGGLVVLGLGRASELDGEPLSARGGLFRWQWVKLDFGQTLLIKRRVSLPDVEESRSPVAKPVPKDGNGQHAQTSRPPGEPSTTLRSAQPGGPSKPKERADAHDIREVVSYMKEHIDDDQVVGRALRRVVQKGTTGDVAGFTAALVDLLRGACADRKNLGDPYERDQDP